MNDAPVMLLTGGTGSIGLEVARLALAGGWAVAMQGRSTETLAAAAATLGSPEGSLHLLAADIAEPQAAERLVARAAEWRGRIDAVVDCVSTGPAKRITGLFADTDPEGFAPLMELSVVHLQRLSLAALPWLKRQGGTIVAFASDAGRFAAARQTIIGASRAGIMGFVRNLAVEVARDGVRVHCVSPSYVAGSRSARRLEAAVSGERAAAAAKKAGLGLPTAADIAPLVLFLCGEGARRITGQVVSVNGGINA